MQAFDLWIFLPNGIEYRIRFDMLILFVFIILVYVMRVNLFVSFLENIQIKSYLFSTAKDTKKEFVLLRVFLLYISFFFSLPDALLSQSGFLQFGDARSQIVWMNCLLFSFFIITKFLCGFNSFSAISSFLFRVFFYMMLSCCDFCAIPYFRFQIWEMGGCRCVSKNVRFFLFF